MAEGIGPGTISVTGNTVLESTLRMKARLERNWIKTRFDLNEKDYILATFHRQETVDRKELLKNLIENVNQVSRVMPVVLPLHPRTIKRMNEFSLKFTSTNIRVMEPVGYKDMTALLAGAPIMYNRFRWTAGGSGRTGNTFLHSEGAD